LQLIRAATIKISFRFSSSFSSIHIVGFSLIFFFFFYTLVSFRSEFWFMGFDHFLDSLSFSPESSGAHGIDRNYRHEILAKACLYFNSDEKEKNSRTSKPHQTQVHKWMSNLNEISKTHNLLQRGCGGYRKRGKGERLRATHSKSYTEKKKCN
jgi:hypothetical protein